MGRLRKWLVGSSSESAAAAEKSGSQRPPKRLVRLLSSTNQGSKPPATDRVQEVVEPTIVPDANIEPGSKPDSHQPPPAISYLITVPPSSLPTTPTTTSHDALPEKHNPPNPPHPPPLPSSQSPLLTLPLDILLHLTHHLSWNTLLALRSTCTSLHTSLPHSHLTTLRTRLIIHSLADETLALASYRKLHTNPRKDTLWDLFYAAFEWQLLERPAKELRCYGCLEIKPLRMFVERMSSRGTGLGGRYARLRRCKDCMRREMNIAGVYWREHWLRRAETVRQRGRVERVVGWVVHGRELRKVRKGEEVGVCAECGTGQFELFWGCVGCFEMEEGRRRREEWRMRGFVMGGEGGEDGGEVAVEGWARWVLERADEWRGRRDKKRQRRRARRAECGGKWWHARRYAGWLGSDVRWEGSWGERVELLVAHLEFEQRRRAPREAGVFDGPTVEDHRKRTVRAEKTSPILAEGATEWKAIDQVPLKKDRREARCAMCWNPLCRRRWYFGGLVYGPKLSLEQCCESCQQEERLRLERGRDPRVDVEDRLREQEAALEALEGLFEHA